jgi:hypothetical protein
MNSFDCLKAHKTNLKKGKSRTEEKGKLKKRNTKASKITESTCIGREI